jgi:RimJ/RimL family protein N-acetyltransferase
MVPGNNEPLVWRKGKKVILRPVIEADLPYFQRWINNPGNNRFLTVHWPQSDQQEQAWFDRVAKSGPDKITVAVCTHDHTLIGNMALDVNQCKKSAITGSIIGNPEFQGKGFGSDAKMLLLDYAFNWCGMRKVTSKIIAFNGRSVAYAKKCGYRHMATIEQEHFRDGKWHDELQYVVFCDEWKVIWEEYKEGWKPEWEG